MEWQPIETAPKDGTRILLYSPDAMEPKCFIGYWLNDVDYPDGGAWFDYWREDTGLPIDADSTHWMPLPEAPNPSRESSTDA